jgi:hemolysin III
MTENIRLGRMENPIRGLLHGSAAAVALVAFVVLLAKSSSAGMTIAVAVYGLALVSMYVTSAMYHSVPWQPRWKERMQVLDHIFIYVLVAATFTPLLTASNRGSWLVVGLIGIWILAGLGALREFGDGVLKKATLPLQFIAGSLVLIPTIMMLFNLDPLATAMTLLGSAAYLLGVWAFVNDRPRLLPGVFSHHEFFHVIVVAASVAHFLAIWDVADVI